MSFVLSYFPFQMPLSKQKTYSRFNVGKMMKERKKSREEAATVHSSIQAAKTVLESEQTKLSRLKYKV